jgi:hypothetical protein
MTEPKRWIDEGPPEAIGRLLEAAASEKPAEASVTRTLGVLGVGVGVAGAASTAGASTAGAALGVASVGKASGVFALGTFAKWAVLATAVTAAGVAGNVVMSREVAPSAARAPLAPVSTAVTAAPKPPRPPSELAPIAPVVAVAPSAQPGEPEPPAVARVAPTTTPKTVTRSAPVEEAPIDAERLAEEVALVDQARGALARGDAGAALRALDEYDARFSERRFAPEALYLRMESLLRLGKSEAARAVAERLAKRFPSSPHTARARQVLTQTNP